MDRVCYEVERKKTNEKCADVGNNQPDKCGIRRADLCCIIYYIFTKGLAKQGIKQVFSQITHLTFMGSCLKTFAVTIPALHRKYKR